MDQLFNVWRFQNIDTDFGKIFFIIEILLLLIIFFYPITAEARATLALELIPILIPGKHKGAKPRRYFVDHRNVS